MLRHSPVFRDLVRLLLDLAGCGIKDGAVSLCMFLLVEVYAKVRGV